MRRTAPLSRLRNLSRQHVQTFWGADRQKDPASGGAVLAGDAEGRRSEDEATDFDSTGLAIQDLAIALAAMEHMNELDLPMFDL